MGRPKGSKNKKTLAKEAELAKGLVSQSESLPPSKDSELSARIANISSVSESEEE